MTIRLSTGKWAAGYIKDWQKEIEVTLEEGATAADLLVHLSFPEDEAGVITRSGVRISREDLLNDGDSITLFPVVIAG